MKLEKTAYIGLGANLGNRIENCIKALGLLSTHPEIEGIDESVKVCNI